jgi:hypothetical protein
MRRCTRMLLPLLLLWIICIDFCAAKQLQTNPMSKISSAIMINRRTVFDRLLQAGHVVLLMNSFGSPTFGFNPSPSYINKLKGKLVSSSMLSSSNDVTATSTKPNVDPIARTKKSTVLYKPMELHMEEFGVTIPVACWFPTNTESNAITVTDKSSSFSNAQYQHRISVRRIGQLLAGWNFIPNFVSKDYSLGPTSVTTRSIVNVYQEATANNVNNEYYIINKAPVVFLSHGYLGSRFDLSHLAEELSSVGFI